MASEHHRRSEPRFKAINLVTIQRFDEQGVVTDVCSGRTLDLSQHGMLLELARGIEVGSKVNISFALGEVVVDVDAVVRSTKAIDDERCEMGIQFVNLSQAGGVAIAEYLAKRS